MKPHTAQGSPPADHLGAERAAQARAAGEKHAAFLAEASLVLGASIDYATTLSSAARVAIPHLADWCVLHGVQPDGLIARLAVAHKNPSHADLLCEIERRFPLDLDDAHGPPRVLRTGQAERVGEVSQATLETIAQSPEHVAMLRQVGLNSYISVPLQAKGNTFAALTLALGESGRRYGEAELEVAGDLARRISSAIEHARLYREAQMAVRTRDEFLAALSHELRAPLSVILGWSRLLGDGKLDPRASVHAIETIERNAKLQAHLIEDILDVSSMIMGKLRLALRPVRLTEIVGAAIEAQRPVAETKEVRIESTLDRSADQVSGDPDRLEQVFWSLLSSAIRHSQRGGQVRIESARKQGSVEVRVSYTGQAISPELLPGLFHRFRQTDEPGLGDQRGEGLGMAIVGHLVELHGGMVHAENPGEGQGTAFLVDLPLLLVRLSGSDWERVAQAAGTEASCALPDLDGLHITLVDDEQDVRDLVSTVLRQAGAAVTVCSSSAEALKAIQQRRPDLLVSDLEMPTEDGYTLIRKVRSLEQPTGDRLPAVALTGYARLEDRRQALLAGYDMHLAKPIEPNQLAAAVASLAGRPRGPQV